jgi:SpoU rRNA methylase family enzyme
VRKHLSRIVYGVQWWLVRLMKFLAGCGLEGVTALQRMRRKAEEASI